MHAAKMIEIPVGVNNFLHEDERMKALGEEASSPVWEQATWPWVGEASNFPSLLERRKVPSCWKGQTTQQALSLILEVLEGISSSLLLPPHFFSPTQACASSHLPFSLSGFLELLEQSVKNILSLTPQLPGTPSIWRVLWVCTTQISILTMVLIQLWGSLGLLFISNMCKEYNKKVAKPQLPTKYSESLSSALPTIPCLVTLLHDKLCLE